MRFAGFWRRFAAYWIDILPITAAVALVFYVFLGFDSALERYLSRGVGDLQARRDFLVARNWIRDLSLALYFGYCGLMEASALRGTFGKWVMGISVVNMDGSPLTHAQAVKRNSAKVLSFLPLGLGCLWVAWSRTKQGWHDKLAGTYVVQRSGERARAEPGTAPDQREHGGSGSW